MIMHCTCLFNLPWWETTYQTPTSLIASDLQMLSTSRRQCGFPAHLKHPEEIVHSLPFASPTSFISPVLGYFDLSVFVKRRVVINSIYIWYWKSTLLDLKLFKTSGVQMNHKTHMLHLQVPLWTSFFVTLLPAFLRTHCNLLSGYNNLWSRFPNLRHTEIKLSSLS